jgi:phosphogluconate dehydratase
MTTQLNARVGEVTNRIVERSRRSRQAYLARIDSAVAKGPARKRLGCANFAHGFAACGTDDKEALREGTGANLAIVTAYNDMLSAHQPYARFPDLIKEAARASFPCSRATSSRCRLRSPFPTTCSTRRSISASATRLCQAS